MDRFGPGPRLVCRMGSGVRVNASFQILALRMLLHTAGGYLLGVFSGGGVISENVSIKKGVIIPYILTVDCRRESDSQQVAVDAADCSCY